MKNIIVSTFIIFASATASFANQFEMEDVARNFYSQHLPQHQEQCIEDNIEVKYLGQSGSFNESMKIEIKNNTQIPTAWVKIEVIQLDAKYGNVLEKQNADTTFKNTLGPGETTVENFYGMVGEGRKVEVKAVNMRDLEGKRLIDDNTTYIGYPFPEEISSVYCK